MPAPTKGTLGAMRRGEAEAAHPRDRALRGERERGGMDRSPSNRSFEDSSTKPGKTGGNASSSGGASGQLPQMVADLEARMARAERSLSSASTADGSKSVQGNGIFSNPKLPG